MNELLYIDDRNPVTCFASFKRIAESLMNDYKLQAGDRFFRIIDCKFYFYSEQHEDCYVHGHKRQKESTGEWYFHGSGLDITIAGDSSHGGILIRRIAEVTTEAQDPCTANPVVGPLNFCTEIFKSFGKALQAAPIKFGLINISMEPMGALMKRARVFAVPRVGLNQEKDKQDYYARPYRFVTFLHMPHREGDRIKKYLTTGAIEVVNLDEFKLYKKGLKW